MVEDWTVGNFKKAIWSDEPLFEVMHPPNPQNDRVWGNNEAEVTKRMTLKTPEKVMVWGAMSAQGLSQSCIC